MRAVLSLVVFLTISAISFGQKTIDTTEVYNGTLTRKKIQFDAIGNIQTEKYYYTNGKIQIEYFFSNGKQIRWITYDITGNQTAEWNDPEVDYAEKRKLRNIAFSITLICIGGLVIAGSRLNYTKTYYSVLGVSIIYPFLAFLAERTIVDNEHSKIFILIIASTLLILPSVLLILSVLNLFKKRKIPLITSIFSILISLGFLLFFVVTILVSGAGMLS